MSLGFVRPLLVFGLTCGPWACDDTESPTDAGVVADQGVAADLGPRFACGDSNCALAGEYCLEIPAAPCVGTDGGACSATEEACVASGVVGCTPPLTRRCEALPATCGEPLPCACLPDLAPCDGPGATCFRPVMSGPVVTCAFP